MKVLVAVDSFKGSLSSLDFYELAKPILEEKGHEVSFVPVSDGGEGFQDVIHTYIEGEEISALSYEPSGEMIQGKYLLKEKTAYVELSNMVGMGKANKLDPMKTSTYGLGLVLKDAIARGAREIVLGIGGSATNDGGAGMIQAMGVDFFDMNGFVFNDHITGETIGNIERFDTWRLDQLMSGVKVSVVCDVTNPLLGKRGATHVFAKQKGAKDQDLHTLEDNMKHFRDVVNNQLLKDDQSEQPGAGAAGGVGFIALSFLNANLISGIDFLKDFTDLENKLDDSDVVIVGEGWLDEQSDEGKAPIEVAKLTKKHKKKVIGVFGGSDVASHGMIDDIYTIVPKYADEQTSIKQPKTYLIELLKQLKITYR